MKTLPRVLLAIYSLISLRVDGATVTWDGGGGSTSWNTAANWSNDRVPGATDDVVIPGAGDVVFSSGNVSIRSLQCARNLSLTGGELTVTGGASTIQGSLNLEAGSLSLRGEGTSFTASGPVAHAQTELSAAGGATLSLPTLTSSRARKTTDVIFWAGDPGSLLDLPNLVDVTSADYYHVKFLAYDGARIQAPRLSKLTGGIEVFAEGEGSAIELPGFQGELRDSSPGHSSIEARPGTSIALPNVTDLDGIDLILRGNCDVSTAQLKSFRGAQLTVDDQLNNFPSLTNLANSSLFIRNAAQVTLLGIRQITRTNSGDTHFTAADPGSILELPNLTDVTVPDYYQFAAEAYGGADIRLPGLSKVNGAISIYAEDDESAVRLTGFQGVLTNSAPGQAVIEVRNGGRVEAPGVTGLHRLELILRGTGQVTIAQLRSITDGEILIDSQAPEFTSLAQIDGTSVTLINGSQLSLPKVIHLLRSKSGDLRLEAADAGSQLDLPNVVDASVVDHYRLLVWAENGGQVRLPKFATMNGAVEFYAEGPDSVVDLPGLSGTFRNRAPGQAGIEARNRGKILIPGVQELARINLTQRSGGEVTTAQLRTLTGGTLLLDGTAGNFGALTNLDSSNITLQNGAQLTLAGIPQLSRTENGDVAFRVTGAGTFLTLPSLTQVTVPEYYRFILDVSEGGRISLPALATVNGSLGAFAEEIGSIIELAGLTGTLGNTGRASAALEARSGGAVLFPNLTGIDRFAILIRGTGSMSTAQLTAIRNSDVLIDAAKVNFGALADSSGTTFRYENGGTAVFQSPTDLVVSGIRVPETVTAEEPFEIVWEISNIGTAFTSGIWTDSVFVSRDVAPGSDELLGVLQSTASMAAGEKRAFTNRVTAPAGFAGTAYIVVAANSTRSLFEGTNHGNNTNVSSAIRVLAPDLIVQDQSVQPPSGLFGKPITVAWTVKNTGSAAAKGDWQDRLSLVRSASQVSGGLFITNALNTAALTAGASYARSVLVDAPVSAEFEDGNYFILVQTDVFGDVPEAVESNNVALVPVTLARPPLPDLAVNRISAPATGLPGEALPITWSVTNQGTAPLEGIWTENVFLVGSDNAVKLIASLNVTNRIVVGDSVLRTDRLTVPQDARAGNFRIRVDLDVHQDVVEKSESNNSLVSDQTMAVPAGLRFNVPVASISEGAAEPRLGAILSRNGDLSSPLTATIASSDPKEVAGPGTVVFRAGDVSVPVVFTVQKDGIPDSDKSVTISATAAGYSGATAQITVLNADIPKLSLQLASTSIAEGEMTELTVSHNGQFTAPTTVHLTAVGNGQLAMPNSVTFAPGQTAAKVQIAAEDDTRVEQDTSYTIKATGAGFTDGTAVILVRDNDLPQFTLTVASANLSEGAGPQATLGTVSRGLSSPRSLTVELQADRAGVISFPSTVIIPAGESAFSFPVGTINNSVVDGTRAVALRAFALTTSSSMRIAETAPVTINILDDDGPALSVAISHELVAEGLAAAASVTVTRNTASTQPLTVNLFSSVVTEATVPPTLVIAAGAASGSAPLTSVDDGMFDGSKTVQITASAPGFTSGSASIVVTDLNRPDLVARDVAGPDTAETEAWANVGYRIYNQGLASAGTNWVTKIYLSDDPVLGNDTLLNEYSFNGSLPVGQFFGQTRQVRMPQGPGQYWVIVETDAASQIDEILESNNTTISAQPIRVEAAYSATVVADLETAQAGTPVPLRGTAVKTSTGGPAPYALVNVHIRLRETKRIISALADEAGHFTTLFKPLPGEAGLYEIGAAHPGSGTAPIQDSFTLYGLKAGEVPHLRLAEGTSVTGQFTLSNPGDRPLTKLALSVAEKPANLQVTTSVAADSIAGLASGKVGFAVSALDASVPEGTIQLRATTAEGAALTIPIAVTVDALRPHLRVDPPELVRGMKVSAQTVVEFNVINDGGAATGPIQVALPNSPWLRLATVAPLASLEPHGTNRVTLQLTPPADLALGAYEGVIMLQATSTAAQAPFTFRALSEAKGDLLITAVDEYTYFAEGAPKLTNAPVVVRDAVSTQTVAEGVTDALGQFSVGNLPEGYYDIEVKADQHTSFREPRLVLAGQVNPVQAFLKRQAVRYIWTVVPTEVQDRTRITVETVFEAFVPMPVITIDPPLIDLADFTAEVTQIDMKVMNHGLIAAKEAKLKFSEHSDWSIEPLIEDLGDIPARASFTVPVLVRRLTPRVQTQSVVRPMSGGGGGCSMGGECSFIVICGGMKVGGAAGVAVSNAGGSGCGASGFGEGGALDGSGGPGGGGGISIVTGSPGDQDGSCDDCLLQLAKAILDCALKFILTDTLKCFKDTYGCITGLAGKGLTWGGGYKCAKAVISCAKAAGAKIPLVGALKYIECAYGLLKGCDRSGGDGGAGGGGNNDTPGKFSLMSLAATGSEPADMFQATGLDFSWVNGTAKPFAVRLERVQKLYRPMIYVLGNEAWFRDETNDKFDSWTDAFLAAVDEASPDGPKINAAERANLLAIPRPATVILDVAVRTIERWNRTIDYWAAGIFNLAQAPAGQSADFIAIDELQRLSQAAQEAFAIAEQEGYNDPLHALQQFAGEFQQFLSEGDGNGVCAHVRIRIDQQMVMTRDAFNATLEIANATTTSLEDISVTLAIRRPNGEDATDLFATRPPTLKELSAVDGTGQILANTTGSASWILVPTTDAARNGPERFLVSGTLHYRQDGLNITVPLAPASIQVLPSPSLAVKYFHERQVFSDDPFTVPIEPSVPYSLAVMVQNKGRGTAHNVRIDSAQPKIVENEKGLLADFKIIATQVENESLAPSLSVDFGQINPGTNAIGRWLLTSTIMGGFIDYSATFEHLDGLGAKKLSLVEGVTIHELIHIVHATGPGDDGRPDFLANDQPDLYDRPDTLHVSDGTVKPVSVVLDAVISPAPSADQLQVQLTANMPPGWTYLRVADPGEGKFRLTKVLRADGFEVPFGENVWTTDRTFLGNARRPVVEHVIHLFDGDSSGRYTLFYAPAPQGDEAPPASAIAPLPTESSARFPVTWAGQDNQGGTGVAFYQVYVSIDQGPFALWLDETIDRSAVYQGALGRNYAFYSIATDQAGNREAAPALPDTRTTVTRANRAPTLEPIADQALREGATLKIQAMASDADQDELTFSISTNAPPGLVLNPYTGQITWVTTEGSGPASYPLTLQVLDSGMPRLGATRSFVLTVTDENQSPVITPIPDRTINEGQLLSFTVEADDLDLPRQTITFSLAQGAPAGAVIDAQSGLFTWKPTATDGGLSYHIGVVAKDDGTPSLTSTQRFDIVVRDTRSDLALAIGSAHVQAGGDISIPLTLTSGADLNTLTFDLTGDDEHLLWLELKALAPEILASALEFVAPGLHRVRLELDPARAQSGTRAVAALHITTLAKGRSSVLALEIDALEAARQNGDGIRNTSTLGGRLFVIEREPMLDLSITDPRTMRAVFYGQPGATLQLQTNSDLQNPAGWQPVTEFKLENTTQTMVWPVQTDAPSFFRLLRTN